MKILHILTKGTNDDLRGAKCPWYRSNGSQYYRWCYRYYSDYGIYEKRASKKQPRLGKVEGCFFE